MVSFREAQLSPEAVQAIASELESAAPDGIVALDCRRLESVTPQGLSALLALGDRHASRLALAGLSRSLARTAVQARLAQHFVVYASCEAFLAASSRAVGQP